MGYARATAGQRAKTAPTAPTVVTVDVGALPMREAQVDVSAAAATPGAAVQCWLVGVGAGRDADELEFDQPAVAGWVPSAGVLRLELNNGANGPVHDTYRVAFAFL